MDEKQPKSEKFNPTGNFILCGEDDIDDEDILREVFEKLDSLCTLVFVNNANTLLSNLHSLPDDGLPALLLLDYNMPQLNASDILLELKKNPRYQQMPKVIWSTSGSNTFRDICLDLGANDYLIKPSNLNELTAICGHILSLCKMC